MTQAKCIWYDETFPNYGKLIVHAMPRDNGTKSNCPKNPNVGSNKDYDKGMFRSYKD